MKQLIELISSILKIDATELTIASGPENIGQWDSLAHINIISAIEQNYDIQITMPEILGVKTVGDLKKIIENTGAILDE